MRSALVVVFVLALAACDELASIAPHELAEGGVSAEAAASGTDSGSGDVNPGLATDAGPE